MPTLIEPFIKAFEWLRDECPPGIYALAAFVSIILVGLSLESR